MEATLTIVEPVPRGRWDCTSAPPCAVVISSIVAAFFFNYTTRVTEERRSEIFKDCHQSSHVIVTIGIDHQAEEVLNAPPIFVQ